MTIPRQGRRDRPDPAGAAFPHGHDPHDRNIRLAPSFPVLDDVQTAMTGVATCIALAAAEHLQARHQTERSTPEDASLES
ncbi:hypothetical protein BN12_320016 [Nostocoides japonicum T1-X7]|uniref:Uncharacterized protein n=1 Tax=Nostocoides japonicum T1-X7 TaxID=1194083 RepID=A0A077M0S9_9MICO|nr:hypothetical protein [Tetrasphaera japonica]CCH78682.1 hypothetical protein BN12_320016 [Tetrasphaera japonica T1-X7]